MRQLIKYYILLLKLLLGHIQYDGIALYNNLKVLFN